MSESIWTVRATYNELQAAAYTLESENAALRAELSELKAQLAQRGEDAEVGKAIRELPDGYDLFHKKNGWWYLSNSEYGRDKREWLYESLSDTLAAAGLLPKKVTP
jgi:regulator of replication initiation timing